MKWFVPASNRPNTGILLSEMNPARKNLPLQVGKSIPVCGRRAVKTPAATPPKGKENTYTVWHEIILEPGTNIRYSLIQSTGFRVERMEPSFEFS